MQCRQKTVGMLLNVSFGLHAFLPSGWLFMAIVILGEAYIMSKYLIKQKYDKKIYLTSAISNGISGIIGIISSIELTGGWWLVVWLPWVCRHEVNVRDPEELRALALYYACAFGLTIIIELLVNCLMLRKQYSFKKNLIATLMANGCSYAFGTLLLIFFTNTGQ